MIDLALVPMPAPRTTRVGDRILAAAAELFYERGITAVGVDLLAEHAGTTKRTLYQRFGSKDGLVAAYLQQRAHTWQTTLVAALAAASPGTPQQGLSAIFRTAEEWARGGSRGCAFVNAWAELSSTQSLGKAVVVEEKRWMLAVLEQVVGDVELAARVHLVYEGAHVATSTLGDGEAYRRGEETARRLLG